MTTSGVEEAVYAADREIDNLQILLNSIIRLMDGDIDKNDLWGLLEVAQRQCSIIKPILEPVSTHLLQLRAKGINYETCPQTH